MDLTTLPDEVKELLRAQLEAGRFESVDEIVIEALRLLQEREELFASHREQLRAQIAEGVAAEERGELRAVRQLPTCVVGSTSACAAESDSSLRVRRSG